jgi:uncharacterized protein (TIGR02646 family)
MIRVEKDLVNIPAVLSDQTRKKWHGENCTAGEYCSDDSHYKRPEVKEALESLYHRKCAYCEKDLLDTDRPVEHYRPKRSNSVAKNCDASHGYFWLCFSWDNLMLACTQCNRKKSSCFDIAGTRASYQDEVLRDLHDKATVYDALELPMLINPEREENLESLYSFNPDGYFETEDVRMRYTIENCGLERPELVRIREQIRNDLVNDLHRCFLTSPSGANASTEQKFQFFFNSFQRFLEELDRKKPFFAWRNYLWNNLKEIVADHDNPIFKKETFAAWLLFKGSIQS